MPPSKQAIRAIDLLISVCNLVSVLANSLIRHEFANSVCARCLYPGLYISDQRTSLSSAPKVFSTCSRCSDHDDHSLLGYDAV
jgi:hypothetical protein